MKVIGNFFYNYALMLNTIQRNEDRTEKIKQKQLIKICSGEKTFKFLNFDFMTSGVTST